MLDRLYVLAFDPGGTTGWAAVSITGDDVTWSFGQFESRDHHSQLWKKLSGSGADAFVVESFEYRNDSRAGLKLDSREYIGVIKLFGQIYGTPVVLQTASQGKAFVSDRNIERVTGWKPNHHDRHAADAYRHLLYYLINGGGAPSDLRRRLLELGWM